VIAVFGCLFSGAVFNSRSVKKINVKQKDISETNFLPKAYRLYDRRPTSTEILYLMAAFQSTIYLKAHQS